MDTINEGTLVMLGFKRRFGKWLYPASDTCWLNENPFDKSWSILAGSTLHYSAITRKSELLEKYKLVTGIDLKRVNA